MSKRVFLDADALKTFIQHQNKRVEAWFVVNWERLPGIEAPVHKSTISRALSSTPVLEPVANALDILFEEMKADPWAWCEPPATVEALAPDWRPMNWWYKVLQPAVSWTRFERIRSHPLDGDDRTLTQERLDELAPISTGHLGLTREA